MLTDGFASVNKALDEVKRDSGGKFSSSGSSGRTAGSAGKLKDKLAANAKSNAGKTGLAIPAHSKNTGAQGKSDEEHKAGIRATLAKLEALRAAKK